MPTITIEKGQNLLDVCIQTYGTLERLFALLQENPALQTDGVDSYLVAGQQLVYTLEADNPTQRYYQERQLVVNTGDLPAELCPDDYVDPDYTECAYSD